MDLYNMDLFLDITWTFYMDISKPSRKLKVCFGKWTPNIVDLPEKQHLIFHSYDTVPKGEMFNIGVTHQAVFVFEYG